VVDQLNGLMERIGGAFEREQAFASDAAHELRTPLAGLRATLELALSRPRENESLRATAEQSLEITLEMEALVATLLDLARVSALTRRPAQAVDLAALLQTRWSAHASAAEKRGLRLEVHVPAEARVETDAALLGRVLDNLVENAVAYAASSSPVEVVVETGGTQELAGWRLSFTNRVQDPDPQLAERALQAFWRADGSRSDTGRHAGLGLPLCRRIVETLGGTLETELVGERFTVRLSLPTC
jgi:two-component system heavy metal sensor histidine kinase CusS